MASRERLELVTDFSSLRAGMIVVVKGCGECGGTHRGMLLSQVSLPHLGKVFPRVPIASCRPRYQTMVGINAATVALKMVFRVQDGLETEHTSQASSPKKLTVGP